MGPDDQTTKDIFTVTEGSKPKIRIMTWNIWFDNITQERIDCILNIIAEKDPDVICLQEVTDETRQMILGSDVIQEKYLKVGGSASGNEFTKASYGSIIISRFPCQFFEHSLPTLMGRTLIVAELIA